MPVPEILVTSIDFFEFVVAVNEMAHSIERLSSKGVGAVKSRQMLSIRDRGERVITRVHS